MNYFFAKPSYPLSLFVKQYWAIENCLPDGDVHIQRIVPTGLMDLTFYMGNRPKALDDCKNIPEDSILSGQQKGYYDITISGRLCMFSISLLPNGARMLFDLPSIEFFDQNIPLRYLVKDKISELEAHLYEAESFNERIKVAEKFLINQLHKTRKVYEHDRIQHSIDIINHSGGMITIDALASAACLSRKQFERTFSDNIGSSPKQFLKAVKFQYSLFQKYTNKTLSLTEIAYCSGYFDQSHMINAYKSLSGITPGQYFAECEPHSDYFM